jgi:hypothetical protein
MRQFFLLFFTTLGLWVHSQCVQSRVYGTSYGTSECNGLFFQSSTGNIAGVYGSCGNLSFQPPLSGGNPTTDTDDVFSKTEIKIFPNPVTNILNLQYEKETISQIVVMDALGQIAKRLEPVYEIDMSYLKSGLYIILFYNKNAKTISTHKILKI